MLWPGELFGEGFENNPVTLVLGIITLALAVVQIVVFVTTVVVFLMWLYRVHENLAAFGVPRNQMQYSSAWAVGSWFVPFVSLYPYRAIKEVWQKSVPNTQLFLVRKPPSISTVGGFGSRRPRDQLYFRLSWRELAPTDVIEIIGVAGGVLGIVAAFLAIKVVREIQRQQVESSNLIPTQPVFQGPPAPPQFGQPGNFGAPSSSIR